MSESRQYIDYLKIKDDPKKEYSMISELIDNSLSSYLKNNDSNSFGQLVVEIIYKFDSTEERKVNERLDSTKAQVYPNSYLQVSDNAYGIKKEKLSKALSLHSISEDQDGLLSVHGIGMKHCAFYFGATLELETYDEETNKKLYIKKDVMGKDPIEPVPDDVVFDKDIEFKYHDTTIGGIIGRGTTVRVNNLYKENKKNMSKSDFINAIDSISHKYLKYINDGRIKIKFKYLTEKMSLGELDNELKRKEKNKSGIFKYEYDKKDDFYSITEVSEKVDSVFYNYKNGHLFSNFSKDEKSFYELIDEVEEMVLGDKSNTKLGEEYKDMMDSDKDFTSKVFNAYKSLFIKAYEEINSTCKKEVDYKFTLSIPQDEHEVNNVDVTFWRLKSRNSNFRGFRVYEHERAIYHPPITTDESSSRTWINENIMHAKESPDERGVNYGWAGEFDLVKFDYENVNDKTKIRFTNKEKISMFQTNLMIVYQIYKLFEISGRAKDQTADDTVIDDKKIDVIIEQIPKMFSSTFSKSDLKVEKNKFEIFLKDFYGSEWKFIFDVNTKKNPTLVWSEPNIIWNDNEEDDIDYNILEMSVFTDHTVWKNIRINKNWVEELLIPYSVIKVFTEAKINIAIKNNVDIPSIQDYNSIFNEMANKKEK